MTLATSSAASYLRNVFQAEELLEQMQLQEFVAEKVERSTGLLQQVLAREYRELIGVEPHHRHLLKQRLTEIASGAALPVPLAIAQVSRAGDQTAPDQTPHESSAPILLSPA